MRFMTGVLVAAGFGAAICAEAAPVNPRHYEPLTLETAQALANDLPKTPTRNDLLKNSAAMHDVPLASIGSLRDSQSPATPSSAARPSTKPAIVSASPACANGFTRVAYGKYAYDCFQVQSYKDNGFITEMDTDYLVGPDGKGLLTYDDFGTGTPVAYGSLIQRVRYAKPQVGLVDGATFEEGEYDNYFFASLQDADHVKNNFCGRGVPVTFEGPSGAIGPDGKPSGGYQLQIAAYAPGTQDASPLPPGDTNICPPQEPTSSN